MALIEAINKNFNHISRCISDEILFLKPAFEKTSCTSETLRLFELSISPKRISGS